MAGVLLGNATLRTLIESMSWAIENGAHIINMSLGFTYYEPMFVEVFNALIHDHDILPIVAIGNDNHGKMAAHPSATVSEIAMVLKETARHPGGDHNRPDNRWGHGIIQPQDALGALSS